MNWLWIVTAAILAACGFYGYRQGLLRIVFSIGSLVIAMILSSVLTPYVREYLRGNTSIYENIREKCQELIEQDPEQQTAKLPDAAANPETEQRQQEIEDLLGGQPLPESLKALIGKLAFSAETEAQTVTQNVTQTVAGSIADLILSALSFLITLAVSRVLIWVVFLLLDVISRIPVLHGVNQITGLALGLLEGLLAIWIFFVILTGILQTSFGQSCMKMVAESRLLSWLFRYNLLMYLFR